MTKSNMHLFSETTAGVGEEILVTLHSKLKGIMEQESAKLGVSLALKSTLFYNFFFVRNLFQ